MYCAVANCETSTKEMQQKLHKHAKNTHHNSQQKDVKPTTYLAPKLNV